MLDVGYLCNIAIQAVYWLVLLACNFLGYSPVWAKNAIKKREHENSVNCLTNISHIAVMINERNVKSDDIVCLIERCLSAGIRKLSIYDPWNDIFSHFPVLSTVCRLKNICLLSRSDNYHHSIENASMIVQLLSSASGKGTLVDVCKTLSRFSYSITASDISNALSHLSGLSDPELLIMIGPLTSLAGYPPWNLRITEFVQVRHVPCSRIAFEDCLSAFRSREIRIGK